MDLARHNIRINAVDPGIIDTRLSASLDPGPGRRPRLPQADPGWAGSGRPRTSPRSSLFLVSDDAGYMTGEDVIVDGGLDARRHARDRGPRAGRAPGSTARNGGTGPDMSESNGKARGRRWPSSPVADPASAGRPRCGSAAKAPRSWWPTSSPTHAEGWPKEIEAAGGRAVGVAVDVSDPEQVQAMVDAGRRRVRRPRRPDDRGRACCRSARRTDTDPDAWNKVIGINLTGTFLAARAVIPTMAQRGGGVDRDHVLVHRRARRLARATWPTSARRAASPC